MNLSDQLIDWLVHTWDGIPRPIPGPLAVARVEKPMAVKIQPVNDGWEDMPPVRVKYENGKEEVKYMQRKIVGLDTLFRPKTTGLVNGSQISHTLTGNDLKELTKRSISQKTGEKLKLIFAVNPDISAGTLAKESGLGMRTCEGALAAFRVAANPE